MSNPKPNVVDAGAGSSSSMADAGPDARSAAVREEHATSSPSDDEEEEASPSPLPAELLAIAPPPAVETLPVANISRIMRRSLPETAKIGKDAKEALQLVLSEFISFVTAEANERCLADRRKTVTGDDVLMAFKLLGLDEYYEVLRIFLTRFRTSQEQHPRQKRRRYSRKLHVARGDDADDGRDDGDEGEAEEGDEDEVEAAVAGS